MRLVGKPGMAAVTYGPCTLATEVDGVPVTITEETDYPFSEAIQFTISPAQSVDFALCLRKPGWAEDVEIVGAVASEEQLGYFVIDKRWSAGEAFSLTFKAPVEVLPYPTGEVAVRRGALQYVLPVACDLHPTKDYPVGLFHDYDGTPHDLEQAYERLILDETRPGYGLVFETNPVVDMNRAWERPPVQLKTGATPLVPMGCTVLRRASFPLTRAGPSINFDRLRSRSPEK